MQAHQVLHGLGPGEPSGRVRVRVRRRLRATRLLQLHEQFDAGALDRRVHALARGPRQDLVPGVLLFLIAAVFVPVAVAAVVALLALLRDEVLAAEKDEEEIHGGQRLGLTFLSVVLLAVRRAARVFRELGHEPEDEFIDDAAVPQLLHRARLLRRLDQLLPPCPLLEQREHRKLIERVRVKSVCRGWVVRRDVPSFPREFGQRRRVHLALRGGLERGLHGVRCGDGVSVDASLSHDLRRFSLLLCGCKGGEEPGVVRGAYRVIVQVLRAVPLGLGVVDGVAPALQVDDLGAAHGHELELVRG